MIEFKNVSKLYQLGLTRTSLPRVISQRATALFRKGTPQPDRDFWALRDVSFEVQAGESLALVGPNGAGKTTIFRLLARITQPTSGTLSVRGRLSALIELGAGFHPDLTGRENVFLNGAILGLRRKEIEKHFDEIVDFSGLERFIDTPLKRYSSGMAVRLGFAVASCIEPEVLLVDEVLAVGDAAFQRKCIERIQQLRANGTCLMFVSHNPYLIRAVCEKALYINQGAVRALGAADDIIDAYQRDVQNEQAQALERSDKGEHEPAGDGEIEITNIEVSGEERYGDGTLDSRYSAQIRLHYSAAKQLGEVRASVFLIRSDGVSACMVRSSNCSERLWIDEGQGQICVRLEPLQLVGGTYCVEAHLLDETDSILLTRRTIRSDWFAVAGAAPTNSNPRSGVFEPRSRWSHTTDQDHEDELESPVENSSDEAYR